MAKLNVVIPAVEVTVGDVTYRKVDRKAQAGDIVRALESDLDIDKGAFYGPVTGADTDCVEFTDNVGDPRRRGSGSYEVYAPISEQATATASDTFTFEGATWRKVDRNVREGDAIKFTNDTRRSYLTGEELYVVDRIDSCDDPQITDDDGDEYDAGGEDYEVYEKVAEEKAEPVTERKARAGDRVRIVDRLRVSDPYNNGDVLTVIKRLDPDRVTLSVNGESAIARDEEFVVLEPITAQPERLAVGDYARVVSKSRAFVLSYIVAGNIVKIAQDDESHRPFRAELTNGNIAGWFTESELVRATDEEVASAKDPRSQFAAGDKVRLVSGGSRHPLNGFSDGEVYTVKNPKDTHHNGDRVEIRLSGGTTGYAYPNQLAKLTAEEVAEIERKQAEEAKWAAIGRKVNEFKGGDIVEGKRRLGDGEIIRGEIENLDGESDQSAGILSYADGKYRSVDLLKLVVPVEQRFDTEEVDVA